MRNKAMALLLATAMSVTPMTAMASAPAAKKPAVTVQKNSTSAESKKDTTKKSAATDSSKNTVKKAATVKNQKDTAKTTAAKEADNQQKEENEIIGRVKKISGTDLVLETAVAADEKQDQAAKTADKKDQIAKTADKKDQTVKAADKKAEAVATVVQADKEFKEELKLSGTEVTIKLVQADQKSGSEAKTDNKKATAAKADQKKTEAGKTNAKTADARAEKAEAAQLTIADIKEGSIVKVTLDEQGNAVSVTVLEKAAIQEDKADTKKADTKKADTKKAETEKTETKKS